MAAVTPTVAQHTQQIDDLAMGVLNRLVAANLVVADARAKGKAKGKGKKDDPEQKEGPG